MKNDILATFLLGLRNTSKAHVEIINTDHFTRWLAAYHHQFGMLKTLLTHPQPVHQKEICDTLEHILGNDPIPQIARRAYLGLARTVYKTYNKLPSISRTSQQVHLFVHLYEILLPYKDDSIEFELLHACYSEDMLYYHSDTELMEMEESRVRQILGMFSYILWMFDGFTLDNFAEWDNINEVVTNKINYLQSLGRGKYKFGSPEHVWQKEQDSPGFFHSQNTDP